MAEVGAKTAHSFQRRYVKLEVLLAEEGIQWNMNSKMINCLNSRKQQVSPKYSFLPFYQFIYK